MNSARRPGRDAAMYRKRMHHRRGRPLSRAAAGPRRSRSCRRRRARPAPPGRARLSAAAWCRLLPDSLDGMVLRIAEERNYFQYSSPARGSGLGGPYSNRMGFIKLVEVGYALPGGRTLFDKVSFKVPDGARVALVGANGVGKTTLLRLVADADEGHKGLVRVIGRLARMPQLIHDARSPVTLRELLIAQAPVELARAGATLVAAERTMQATSTQAAGIAYADAVHRWGELGGYDLEVGWNAACMAATGEPFEAIGARVANTFSGGELKRILLEALFCSNAEVLLLDEPDNFLDVLGKEWLEAAMSASRKTFLYISHDREFLGNTSTQIVTLEAHGTWTHPASFASYEEARRARIAGLEA